MKKLFQKAVPKAVLGRSWGGLGEVLGSLWEVLGGLGEVLGPLGAVLGRYVAAAQFLMDFWSDFGSILEPKRVPKWSQNGGQNEPKLKPKFNMKNDLFWDRLGVVLGQFWVVFGPILG